MAVLFNSLAFPASFRVVSALWVSSGCPLVAFRLVGVFLFPCLLYWCGWGKTAYQSGAVLGRCSFVVSGVVAFLVVRVGLVSVWLSGMSRPDCLKWWLPWGLSPFLLTLSGRAVVLSFVWVCGLNWRVSCLCASVLPLVCLRRSLRVVFAVVPTAFCVGGLAAYRVRVVCGSVVLLPLVCASGVLSGLHPLPFLLSVFGLGVPLVGLSGLGVWSVWCGYILHQTQRSHICTRFQFVTK